MGHLVRLIFDCCSQTPADMLDVAKKTVTAQDPSAMWAGRMSGLVFGAAVGNSSEPMKVARKSQAYYCSSTRSQSFFLIEAMKLQLEPRGHGATKAMPGSEFCVVKPSHHQ